MTDALLTGCLMLEYNAEELRGITVITDRAKNKKLKKKKPDRLQKDFR